MTSPKKVFCSYAHSDEKLRSRFEKHLDVLRRAGLIDVWHDRKIDAGDDWARSIDAALNEADIIIFLVSSDFLASEYCSSVEVKSALERHKQKSATVVPVILRDCCWNLSPFASCQALPRDGKAVCSRVWKNSDEAFSNVVVGLETLIRRDEGGASPARTQTKSQQTSVPAPEAPQQAAAASTGTRGVSSVKVLRFPKPTIRCVAWSPDGARLAALGRDTVCVWTTSDWKLVDTFDIDRWHGSFDAGRHGIVELLSLAWAPTSDVLAVTTRHDLLLWRPARQPPEPVSVGSLGWLWGASYSRVSPVIALGTGIAKIYLHDGQQGTTETFAPGNSPVYKPVWSNEGSQLACGAEDGTVFIAERQGGELTTVARIPVGYPGIHAAAWSPDDAWLACGTWKGPVVMKHWQDNQELILEGHVEQVDQLSFSADGRWLVTKAQDHMVFIWNVQTGERVHEMREQIAFLGGGAVFHPRRPLLATLSDSPREVRIWSVETLL